MNPSFFNNNFLTMPLPELTPDELYVINYMKSRMASAWSPHEWSYLLTGVVLCALGAYYESIPFLVCAFIVVCGFRVSEDLSQRKWLPVWRSIFEKYEAAARGGNVEGDTAAATATAGQEARSAG